MKNSKIEEIKVVAKQLKEKIEALTVLEVLQEEDLLRMARDIAWWLNPERNLPIGEKLCLIPSVAKTKKTKKK